MLAAIRKKTDLIPVLVEKVDATPRRTAALVEGKVKKVVGCRLKVVAGRVNSDQSAVPSGEASGRLRAKRIAAGRERAVVKDRRDRAAIRAEVKRLMAQGFSQKAACEEVADQARKGRAGKHALRTKYDMGEFEATRTVVRRLFGSNW